MKNWDTEKIVGAGMILALLITICGNIVFALMTEQFPTSDLAKDIALVLGGDMGKDVIKKAVKDKPDEKISDKPLK